MTTEEQVKIGYEKSIGYLNSIGVSLDEYLNDHRAGWALDEQEYERHSNDMHLKYNEPMEAWYARFGVTLAGLAGFTAAQEEALRMVENRPFIEDHDLEDWLKKASPVTIAAYRRFEAAYDGSTEGAYARLGRRFGKAATDWAVAGFVNLVEEEDKVWDYLEYKADDSDHEYGEAAYEAERDEALPDDLYQNPS